LWRRAMLFHDRQEAGQRLAESMQEFRGSTAIVLGVPRGGVVTAYEIARALELPLDVLITHKLGAPGNPEYAIGAIAENGGVMLNDAEIDAYGIPRRYVEQEIERQGHEIERRKQMYRGGAGLPPLKGRPVIVVDDGVATGFTTAAALKAARAESPSELVLAVPVAPRETLAWLSTLADKVVCLATPEPFLAVGRFYLEFGQVSDEEVCRLLEMARGRERAAGRD
jgi:putative phosphoribosyl transferase